MAKDTTTTSTTGAKGHGVSVTLPNITAGVRKAALEGIKTAQFYNVPLDSIRVIPGFNVRITSNPNYQKHLKATADSIYTNGFYSTKPLSGFVGKDDDDKDVIFLTDGHTRLAATKMANAILREAEQPEIETLPMGLKPEASSMRDLNIAMVQENEGFKLGAVEKAVAVKRLRKDGMKEGEIAAALNVTDRYIKDLILLIDGPKEVRSAAASGKISGTEAISILRKHPPVIKKDENNKDVKDYSKAEGVVKALVARAEAKAVSTGGKARATNKDTRRVKMQTIAVRWNGAKGDKFKLEEVRPFLGLVSDTDWYTLLGAEGTGTCELTQDIAFVCKVSRQAPEKAEDAPPPAKKEKPAKQAKAAPPKKGAKPVEKTDSADDL